MMRPLSRRHLIQGAAGLLTILGTAHAALAETPAAFAALRAKWKRMQTGAGLYDPADAANRAYITGLDTDARQWRTTLVPTPAANGALWNDAFAGTEVVNTRTSLDRLRLLAVAWATPGSAWENDTALLGDIEAALTFIADHRYNLTIAQTGNWWEWQIGAPLALLDTVLVLDGRLDPALVARLMAAVDRFTPAPAMTAANLVWTSHIVLLRGLISEDPARIQAAITAVATTFANVTSGDGFHADGSFVQHDEFAYTGGYGLSLLQRTTDLLYLLDGTAFAPAPASWQPLRQRVYTAFEPLMDRGGLMDMVLGRGISRSYGQGHQVGRQVTAALARLAMIAPEPDASNFKSMVKAWVAADTVTPILAYDPLLRMSMESFRLLKDITAGPVTPRARIVANTQYPAMDRIVHTRPRFTFAVAQSSRFIGRYESVNAENLHGWYTGSGMTYLYNGDLGHYQNDFWPTVDMYRLPGTTVDTRRLADSQFSGDRGEALVGGAADGEDGIACMQFSEYGGELRGKKAWFMFGDAVLCVGADITCTSTNPVETIVENRNAGPGGAPFPALAQGNGWTHISGVGGYVFAGSAAPKVLTEARSGTWLAINNRPSSPTDTRTRNFVTLWLDHGTKPRNGSYAYTLLPSATAAQTARWTRRPGIRLIRNSAVVQHARSATLEAAVFWAAGSSGSLSCDAPACVLIRRAAGRVEIALADPSEDRTQPIVLKITGLAGHALSHDPEIKLAQSGGAATILFDPTGTRGQTRKILLHV